jgi:hypothetical protein
MFVGDQPPSPAEPGACAGAGDLAARAPRLRRQHPARADLHRPVVRRPLASARARRDLGAPSRPRPVPHDARAAARLTWLRPTTTSTPPADHFRDTERDCSRSPIEASPRAPNALIWSAGCGARNASNARSTSSLTRSSDRAAAPVRIEADAWIGGPREQVPSRTCGAVDLERHHHIRVDRQFSAPNVASLRRRGPRRARSACRRPPPLTLPVRHRMSTSVVRFAPAFNRTTLNGSSAAARAVGRASAFGQAAAPNAESGCVAFSWRSDRERAEWQFGTKALPGPVLGQRRGMSNPREPPLLAAQSSRVILSRRRCRPVGAGRGTTRRTFLRGWRVVSRSTQRRR